MRRQKLECSLISGSINLPIAIVDAIDELVKAHLLSFSEQTRSAIAGWPIHCCFFFLGLDCRRFVKSWLLLRVRAVEVMCTSWDTDTRGGGVGPILSHSKAMDWAPREMDLISEL